MSYFVFEYSGILYPLSSPLSHHPVLLFFCSLFFSLKMTQPRILVNNASSLQDTCRRIITSIVSHRLIFWHLIYTPSSLSLSPLCLTFPTSFLVVERKHCSYALYVLREDKFEPRKRHRKNPWENLREFSIYVASSTAKKQIEGSRRESVAVVG